MGDVANALGGQRAANVAAFAVTLDQAPGVDEVVHHLADAPFRDAEPDGQVLTGDHRVVGDEVERPLLRLADAEGPRSLRHTLKIRYRKTPSQARPKFPLSRGQAEECKDSRAPLLCFQPFLWSVLEHHSWAS